MHQLQNEHLAKLWAETLQEEGLAPVARHIPRHDDFLDISIEAQRFKGTIFGDALVLRSKGSAILMLGEASIANYTVNMARRWCVSASTAPTCIDLALSDLGRRALAVEFGLALPGYDAAPFDTLCAAELFYASRAFDALVAWGVSHPRLLKTLKGNDALGDWPASVASRLGHQAG